MAKHTVEHEAPMTVGVTIETDTPDIQAGCMRVGFSSGPVKVSFVTTFADARSLGQELINATSATIPPEAKVKTRKTL